MFCVSWFDMYYCVDVIYFVVFVFKDDGIKIYNVGFYIDGSQINLFKFRRNVDFIFFCGYQLIIYCFFKISMDFCVIFGEQMYIYVLVFNECYVRLFELM